MLQIAASDKLSYNWLAWKRGITTGLSEKVRVQHADADMAVE